MNYELVKTGPVFLVRKITFNYVMFHSEIDSCFQ